MSKNPSEPTSKREEAARMLAKQRKSEKRTKILTFSIAAAALLAIAVPTALVLNDASAKQDSIARAASAPIDGLKEYKVASANHTQDPVTYQQSPGIGGDHFPVWQNCGIYREPVQETAAVHSMEHGAVWISYNGISDADRDALEAKVGKSTYMLLTPFTAQASPIVLSAWGAQLSVDTLDDPRIDVFIKKYRLGSQTPEPGAACTGGLGVPA